MPLHHEPAQQVFNWLCDHNNIPVEHHTDAAVGMREHVRRIRILFRQPIGRNISYDDPKFRAAYMIAYFPYYIEPVYHALNEANLPDSLFADGSLNIALFGGGPCPELLGVAAYLRERAPDLSKVMATVFDRQTDWRLIQNELVTSMITEYRSPATNFTLTSKQCNVVDCLKRTCRCDMSSVDIIVAQNFLTEIFENREQIVETFEWLLGDSGCRYLVFVENNFGQVRELMDDFSVRLYRRRLITSEVKATYVHSYPSFSLPDVLQKHLYTGEDGLIPRSNVKFLYMVLEIAR